MSQCGGDEGHPLALALHDEARGRALHPAGSQAAVDLAPEDRRDLPAHEAIEDAAGLGGVDQAFVDVAGSRRRR